MKNATGSRPRTAVPVKPVVAVAEGLSKSFAKKSQNTDDNADGSDNEHDKKEI
jgi:hypothetical protein